MIVRGKSGLLYAYDNGQWKLLVCLRSITLNVSTDFIETSTVGSNNFWTGEARQTSFVGSAECFLVLDVSSFHHTPLRLPDLRALQIGNTKLLCRFDRTDDSGNIYTDEAYFYISNTTDTGSTNEVYTWTIELKGTGSITQVFTPTPQPTTNKVQRYQDYSPVQDATSLAVSSLIGTTILKVVTTGVCLCKIIT